MAHFNKRTTAEDVADFYHDRIAGTNVLITGVSVGGVGFEAARVISKHGAFVVLTGRTLNKLEDAKAKILADSPQAKLRTLILDLSSFASVRKAAQEVSSYAEPINVLINNAAVFPSEYQTTVDGFEMQLETNHLGPFLFTALIYPKLVASGNQEKPCRIVNISSRAHLRSEFRFEDITYSDGKDYTDWVAYASTKTANILFTKEIARRAQAKNIPLLAYSLHPGLISTGLNSRIKLEEWVSRGFKNEKGEWTTTEIKTLAEGAATYLVASFDPNLAQNNGAYLADCQATETAPHANDEEAAKKLWALSEELVKQPFLIE